MKKYKIILIGISIIIISNIRPFTALFELPFVDGLYRYSNADGTFTFQEIWTRNYQMMQRNFKDHLLHHAEPKDKNVYRLFWKNPFAFWRWRLYFTEERYQLPYKDWEGIKKLRTKDPSEMNSFVDF